MGGETGHGRGETIPDSCSEATRHSEQYVTVTVDSKIMQCLVLKYYNHVVYIHVVHSL